MSACVSRRSPVVGSAPQYGQSLAAASIERPQAAQVPAAHCLNDISTLYGAATGCPFVRGGLEAPRLHRADDRAVLPPRIICSTFTSCTRPSAPTSSVIAPSPDRESEAAAGTRHGTRVRHGPACDMRPGLRSRARLHGRAWRESTPTSVAQRRALRVRRAGDGARIDERRAGDASPPPRASRSARTPPRRLRWRRCARRRRPAAVDRVHRGRLVNGCCSMPPGLRTRAACPRASV